MGLNEFRDEAGAFLEIVDPSGKEPVSKIFRMCGSVGCAHRLRLGGNPGALSGLFGEAQFLTIALSVIKLDCFVKPRKHVIPAEAGMTCRSKTGPFYELIKLACGTAEDLLGLGNDAVQQFPA